MEVISNNSQYIAFGFSGLFLVPQIIHSYRIGSLKEISTISLIFITIMSSLWSYYMYKMNYVLYVYITGFVCLNSIILLSMQLWNYYKRFELHVNTFETKPKPEPEIEKVQTPIILQMPPQEIIKEKTEEVKVDITDDC